MAKQGIHLLINLVFRKFLSILRLYLRVDIREGTFLWKGDVQ